MHKAEWWLLIQQRWFIFPIYVLSSAVRTRLFGWTPTQRCCIAGVFFFSIYTAYNKMHCLLLPPSSNIYIFFSCTLSVVFPAFPVVALPCLIRVWAFASLVLVSRLAFCASGFLGQPSFWLVTLFFSPSKPGADIRQCVAALSAWTPLLSPPWAWSLIVKGHSALTWLDLTW